MNIKEAKEEVAHTLQAYHRRDEDGNYCYPLVRQRPILLMGPPGIGKTAIMEQVAEECQVGLVAYTITHHTRQSAIGLPHIEEKVYNGKTVNVTEYTMSEIIASVYECMERTGKQEGILFIDEINCVSETLAPTMLQFLQNKTFGSHKVPEGWVIVAAGNPPDYNKSDREFDEFTLDRVRKIEIDADCGVWMEYAWGHRIHGAVLSYLSVKEENFYSVENTVDGKFFVTARGWEDLSEILKHYEELHVPVRESLVVQYLQKEEVARDFFAYYQLFCKYGTDYGIKEILEESIEKETYEQKTAMAKAASFEERFTVVNLVLDYLNGQWARYRQLNGKVLRLHQALKQWKEFPGSLEELAAQRKNSFEEKIREEQVSLKEYQEEVWVQKKLEEYQLSLRKEHIWNKKEGFGHISVLFQQEVDLRAKLVEGIQKRLDRAFVFIEDCFGEDQEMVLFVSGVTRNEMAMEYLSSHRNERYFHYSEQLLYRQREARLQKECLEILEGHK